MGLVGHNWCKAGARCRDRTKAKSSARCKCFTDSLEAPGMPRVATCTGAPQATIARGTSRYAPSDWRHTSTASPVLARCTPPARCILMPSSYASFVAPCAPCESRTRSMSGSTTGHPPRLGGSTPKCVKATSRYISSWLLSTSYVT